MDKVQAFRSRVMHFPDDQANSDKPNFQYLEDAVLLVKNGKIESLADAKDMAQQGFDLQQCLHFPKQLIVAGFIDPHVHAPQMDVMASFGEQLLDWLEKYTFPTEIKFSDKQHSEQQSARFVNSLLANGTTSAMVFTTSFKHSTDHLFEQANAINMRLIAGKVMMDRNAPDALLDTAEQAKYDCEALIDNWHGTGRLGYALTPRFAGTSTRQQLAVAGEIFKRHPDLWLQTHLSENLDEITWTQSLFPEAKDYLNTYELFDLVGPKTTFAHCIHLNESEIERIATIGCNIAFCPSSNLFLGSGLFNLAKLKSYGIPIALASDVGGGTSLSQFRTMADAYKVCQLQNYSLAAAEAFFLSSLGAAQALSIADHVGNFEIGKEADFIVINPALSDNVHQRVKLCNNIEEELFVYMTMGDERLIERTYIYGEQRYQNNMLTNEPSRSLS
ncbi:guanine deaminase [Agarilytica rhodophyticola]|uniref:guanine deaminase n=1 Tax=Agarilytica rhodophyticola TaxID=1737490 RepID=UPI000B343084|nr:guanine deaminase [Agarilytica rhodophyticola]